MPNQTSVVVKHCICYKLEQDRSRGAERMMGNNEPRCLSAKWQNMSWWRTWLISKSHSASTRGPLSCGRGKKGFHKISSANQQAGNDDHACGWADALPAETNPDIMLLPVSERGYKKTTSMSPAEIWHQKYSSSNPKLCIIREWRSLPILMTWCLIGQRNCSFYGLQTLDHFRNCLFLTFINHSVLIIAEMGLTL